MPRQGRGKGVSFVDQQWLQSPGALPRRRGWIRKGAQLNGSDSHCPISLEALLWGCLKPKPPETVTGTHGNHTHSK